MRKRVAALRQRVGVDWSQQSTKAGGATTLLVMLVGAGLDRLPEGQVSWFIWAGLGVAALFGAKGLLIKDQGDEPAAPEPDGYDDQSTAQELPEDLQDLIDEGRE